MEEKNIDVITMTVINNAMASIIDEMDMTVIRTTTSSAQRDIFDFLCSFANAKGEVIVEGEESVLHANLCNPVINSWIREHGIDSIHPGDMFCINDPYTGASHFPDLTIIHPIFLDGQLVAWTGIGGHITDVGGRVGGSCDCLSRTCFEEGLRIPMVKVCDRGIRNDTFFTILAANSRLQEECVEQLEPFLAGCRIAERRFLELVRKYDWETVNMYLDALLDYAEHRARDEIRKLPNGVYEFEDYLDDDGFGSDPIRFCVKITVDEDTITYDWTGSAPQMEAGMNNPGATTRALCYIAFRSLLPRDIPHNGGPLRAVKVIVPEGTVVNPVLPGPTGARGVTIARIHEVLLGAQAQICPDKMPACAEGINALLKFSLFDKRQRKGVIFSDLLWGGWGGRPTNDGDQLSPLYLNANPRAVEIQEDLYPLRYNQRAFVPDSEGAGKYRGGFAVVNDYQILADETTLQLRCDRCKLANYGLHGGQPGSLGKYTLNPDGENRDLLKCVIPMRKGDVLRTRLGGAGGWGSPLERDVELVMNDVRNELVSVRRARDVYGVVINEATMQVDMEQTQSLRQSMKKGNTKTNDMVAGT